MSKRKPGKANPKSNRELRWEDARWETPNASAAFFDLADQPQFKGTEAGAVVLPPSSISVSKTPHSGGMIVKAYAHGLEYGNQMAMMGGYLAIGTLAFIFPLSMLGVYAGLNSANDPKLFNWFGLTLDLLLLLMALLMIRFDTIGYRYTPILFNRATGRVHVFVDHTRLFSLWPLWGGGKHDILTYDWSCIRAQIKKFQVVTGTVARTEAILQLVVLKAPDDPRVVNQFGLGYSCSAMAIQPLLDAWEHLRRFMEHEGPLFAEGDAPCREPARQSFLGALFWGQPLIGPGSKEYRDSGDTSIYVGQALLIWLLPVTMLIGLIRWTTFRLKSEPKWPADILAAAGGNPIEGMDLGAWRDVIPERTTIETGKPGLKQLQESIEKGKRNERGIGK